MKILEDEVISLLEEERGFVDVAYDGQDAHALYFTGEYEDEVTEVKLVKDEPDELSLFERKLGYEDWEFVEYFSEDERSFVIDE